MIKKTILLATALMLAATTATYAKSLRVTNDSGRSYFYKVGKTVKQIKSGSTKSFSIKGLKNVKITAGTSKSGDKVSGNKVNLGTYPVSQIKANPSIQTNPASGQTTPAL